MKKKQLFQLMGIGMAVIVSTWLILVMATYYPGIDDTMADINIKAVREGLYGPYYHSEFWDRVEVLAGCLVSKETMEKMFPSRPLKPLNLDLHPWGKLPPDKLKIEMTKTAVKIGMPVMAKP